MFISSKILPVKVKFSNIEYIKQWQCFDIMKICMYGIHRILLKCKIGELLRRPVLGPVVPCICAFVARAMIAISSNRQFPQIFQSSGKSSAMWADEGWQV